MDAARDVAAVPTSALHVQVVDIGNATAGKESACRSQM